MQTQYGKIEVANQTSIEGVKTQGQKLSPLLKEKLVFIGHLDCYERGSEIASVLLNIKTNDTSIYRLTNEIASRCDELLQTDEFRNKIEVDESDYLYVQSDGSMLLTREKGWREVKLGRLFKGSSIHSETPDRQWIKSSEYVSHFGSHTEFEDKMSPLIDDTYKKLPDRVVFLGDGAKWQWKWADAEYPAAIQVLDYYHAMEYVGAYLGVQYKSAQKVDILQRKMGKIMKQKGGQSVYN